jgi:hypothetical protein
MTDPSFVERGFEMGPNHTETIRSIVRRRLLVSIATVALLLVSLGAGTASAGGGQHSTFTKWITSWPQMAGIVGGAVGDGEFVGEVIDYARARRP